MTAVTRNTRHEGTNQKQAATTNEPVKVAQHTAVKHTSGSKGKQLKNHRVAKTLQLQVDTTTDKRLPQYQLIDSTDDELLLKQLHTTGAELAATQVNGLKKLSIILAMAEQPHANVKPKSLHKNFGTSLST